MKNGRFIISVHGFFQVDHPFRDCDPTSTLQVWDATTGEKRISLKGHTGQICSWAISPDGRFIVSASTNGTLKVWDTAIGHYLLTFPVGVALHECAFHHDGKRLVAYSNLGMFFLRLVV